MINLIDYDYVGSFTPAIALNGLCQTSTYYSGKILYSQLAKNLIEPSARCQLNMGGGHLPECIECLSSRAEGLYEKTNRL